MPEQRTETSKTSATDSGITHVLSRTAIRYESGSPLISNTYMYMYHILLQNVHTCKKKLENAWKIQVKHIIFLNVPPPTPRKQKDKEQVRQWKGKKGKEMEGKGREGKGKGREEKGKEGKEWKGMEGNGREEKGREENGKGREGKGRESLTRECLPLHSLG